jgi:hypothetical protein
MKKGIFLLMDIKDFTPLMIHFSKGQKVKKAIKFIIIKKTMKIVKAIELFMMEK